MKKNTKNFIFLAILTLFFTGCVKYNVNMTVGEDKSVTLEAISAIDASMANGMVTPDDETTGDESGDDMTIDEGNSDGAILDDNTEDEESQTSTFNPDEYKFLEEKGYKVEEYKETTEDGATLSGVKISKTFANIDDITKEKDIVINFATIFGDVNYDDSQFFSKNGSNYKASFLFDFSPEQDTDYSMYENYFDMEYKITLPNGTVSNNATKVSEDGKTLTWDLDYGKINEINFEFKLDESNDMLLIIIGGIAIAAVVIGVVTFIVIKKKKNNKNTVEENVIPVVPKEENIQQQNTTPVMEQTNQNVATVPTENPQQPVINPETPQEPVVIISEPTAEIKNETPDNNQNPTMPQ